MLSPVRDAWKQHTLTSADFAQVDSRNPVMHESVWSALAQQFHTTPEFLRLLNPQAQGTQGESLKVPNLAPSFPLPQAERIEISLSESLLKVYDSSNTLVACFPCSVARDPAKRPEGSFRITTLVPNPNYTLTRANGTKSVIPPGPNNPVGTAWIGLSIPSYGIHGTPRPRDISRTGSKGCFRLANWNAEKLLHMVKPGTPVVVR